MDKYADKVFKYLISCPGHSFNCISGKCPDGLLPKRDFMDACDYLVDNGYAEYVFRNSVNSDIHVTHLGMHKREIEIRAFWKMFLTHYLPGFVTGVATSLIATYATDWIQSLFGK